MHVLHIALMRYGAEEKSSEEQEGARVCRGILPALVLYIEHVMRERAPPPFPAHRCRLRYIDDCSYCMWGFMVHPILSDDMSRSSDPASASGGMWDVRGVQYAL